MPAGRPPNKFVQDHFIKGRGVDNDSKRFYYHCYYCNDERELQHRDSRLALHLTSFEDCPNAPESARTAGFQEILRKGKVSQGEIGQPLLPLPPTDTSGSHNLDSEASNASGTSATVTVPVDVSAVMIPSKKRRSQASTLAGWVDVGLTERQISDANLALFRYVVVFFLSPSLILICSCTAVHVLVGIWPFYLPRILTSSNSSIFFGPLIQVLPVMCFQVLLWMLNRLVPILRSATDLRTANASHY